MIHNKQYFAIQAMSIVTKVFFYWKNKLKKKQVYKYDNIY
jgi:hypothetical protein